jgi:recombination protein RecT
MAEIKKNEVVYTQEELSKHSLVLPKNIGDQVYNTLSLQQQNNRLSFPKNYDLGNALTSAYLIIAQDNKLKCCDNQSIVQSMIDMATMGLNPSKKQCYFIPMGNKCTLMTSYFGKQTALKRIKGIKDIRSDVIYEGTEYELFVDEYGNDDIKIIKPCPLKDRKQDKIEGAWARIIMDKDVWGVDSYVSIMTIEDIKNAHKLGSARGGSKAHQDFLNEMAKKSAINRCVKNFINTKADEDLIIESFNNVVNNEYKEEKQQEEYYVQKDVNTNDIFNQEVVEEEKESKVKEETQNIKQDDNVIDVEIEKETLFDDDIQF